MRERFRTSLDFLREGTVKVFLAKLEASRSAEANFFVSLHPPAGFCKTCAIWNYCCFFLLVVHCVVRRTEGRWTDISALVYSLILYCNLSMPKLACECQLVSSRALMLLCEAVLMTPNKCLFCSAYVLWGELCFECGSVHSSPYGCMVL